MPIPRRQCHGCFRPLDHRGYCVFCQAAQVICPRCRKMLSDGPDYKPNFQVCRDCLRAIGEGEPAALQQSSRGLLTEQEYANGKRRDHH